jgi:dipeptidyl aminopeptidase/acylaminoacyl peptidase
LLTRLSVAALLAAAALAAPATAATFPAPARIVYSTDEKIHTIGADGSDRRTIADGAEPAWSPDGGSIAYVTEAPAPLGDEHEEEIIEELGGSQIRVAVADGSGARAITAPGEHPDQSPPRSPDGQRIAFVRVRFHSDDRLRTTLITASAAGGDERKVAEIVSGRYNGFFTADWSPDGTRLLVSVVPFFGEDTERLYTVDIATGARRLVLRNAGWGRWSPDGARITYVAERRSCNEPSCREVYIANADGSGRRRLTTNGATDVTPSWSGDGERIAFASDRNLPNGSAPELYSIRTDGSCMTWLTNGTARSYSPDFAPGAAPTDPGACGATPREPLIETDTSEVAAAAGAVWWAGPRFGNLLLSDAEVESGAVDFDYDDCAAYEPSDCPPPFALSNVPVCRSSILFYGNGKNVARHEGALVHRPPDDSEDGSQFFVGATSVTVVQLGEDVPGVDAGALWRFPETAPPEGGLPRAELPLRFWRDIEGTRAAVRKYGVKGAARRLRRSRSRVANAVALDKRLRELGPFGRLDCAKQR